jgi:DNA-binding transcriptional ArsR family regulator
MAERRVAARELGEIFSLLSHPDRIRIVEELRNGELDVGALEIALDLPQARVSQHLSKMRTCRIVAERREGRHHYYHLVAPELARWLLEGLRFVETGAAGSSSVLSAVVRARDLWQEQGGAKTD